MYAIPLGLLRESDRRQSGEPCREELSALSSAGPMKFCADRDSGQHSHPGGAWREGRVPIEAEELVANPIKKKNEGRRKPLDLRLRKRGGGGLASVQLSVKA